MNLTDLEAKKKKEKDEEPAGEEAADMGKLSQKLIWKQMEKEKRVIDALADESGGEWKQKVEEGDTRGAWTLWSQVAETFFLELCEEEGLRGDEKRYRGRGAPARRQKATLLPKEGPLEVGPVAEDLRARILVV